jgi:peroxiredoxin
MRLKRLMAEANSSFMLAIGSSGPDFSLPDAAGTIHPLSEVRGPKGLVVAFICNHCPYVVHLAESLTDFAANCIGHGVGFVAINSNDVERYPADAPDKMGAMRRKYRWDFPYLYDESQAVARAYGAVCTPDFFLLDSNLKLVYSGQYDASRPSSKTPVTGVDLHDAMSRMLKGEPPAANPKPSTGCSIKWKPGLEPLPNAPKQEQ